ncbi:MAG: pyridoxal-phosphate dependent enzyme [Chloroherpetonaceae bacterium]|nr:pyridoxal-phosphate dependent enzyme [Chloroherpetonaceae bacterium]
MPLELPIRIGPAYDDALCARERIKPFVKRTPVMTSESLNRIARAELFFKCENLQKVGAFKFRGACNATFALSDDEAKRGVATHSSGNHAAALALAAKLRGISATIVMPKNSSTVKIEAVKSYGGDIVFCEPTLQAREETLNAIVKRTGATFIPPYNHCLVIAGQATATLELLEDAPELDCVVVPIGGGGLISGAAIATAGKSPSTKVIGAEPKNADDAYRSFKSGKLVPQTAPDTIADGLRTSLGNITFSIIRRYVADIFTAKEETIVQAMKLVWERMKLVIEPSAAVPLAVVLERNAAFAGKRVGVILSGGNVDLSKRFW